MREFEVANLESHAWLHSADTSVKSNHTVYQRLFLEEIGFVSEEVFAKIQDGVRFLLGLNLLRIHHNTLFL